MERFPLAAKILVCLMMCFVMIITLIDLREELAERPDMEEYQDYKITDIRYYLKQEKRGILLPRTVEKEAVEVFYSDTKANIDLESIKIGKTSVVREYPNSFKWIEVYLTKEDYLQLVEGDKTDRIWSLSEDEIEEMEESDE